MLLLLGGVIRGGFLGCNDGLRPWLLAVLVALIVRVIGMTTLSIYFATALTASSATVAVAFTFLIRGRLAPTSGGDSGRRFGPPLGRLPTTRREGGTRVTLVGIVVAWLIVVVVVAWSFVVVVVAIFVLIVGH